jgi:two-component system sensor kinase FixL
VSVSDTGGGVAAENEDKLFSAFVSTKRDGMGVGLSICRRIVEAHGGQMWFQPTDEGGAEFLFTLPIISGEASDDAS